MGFGVRERQHHMRGTDVREERGAFFIEAHERLVARAVEDRCRFPFLGKTPAVLWDLVR